MNKSSNFVTFIFVIHSIKYLMLLNFYFFVALHLISRKISLSLYINPVLDDLLFVLLAFGIKFQL